MEVSTPARMPEGPAGDGLEACVEADTFGAVDGVVAEEGAFPFAEGMEGHGNGNGLN